jgi:N,N'-diacetyllegionaminate synthase
MMITAMKKPLMTDSTHNLAVGFKVAGRQVGPQNPCFVIAEVGQTHDGSLGTAYAYIDAVAKAGVDAVKFQTHIAEAESTPSEPWRVKFSPQDATRYDYWKRMEFSEDQWSGLAEYAKQKGLIFLSSPFSFEALQLLDRIGCAAWKIGSGEVTNLPMIERMAQTGKPVLLSSGMSSWAELDQAVESVRENGAPFAVFQCTSKYPCPPEMLGLNLLEEMRQRYSCPVGFSDHSGTTFAGLAARTLGANLIEVHVAFSRECFGPDVSVSVTTDELRQLVLGVRFIEVALANPVDKDSAAKGTSEMRLLFGKSIVAARNLPSGHRLGAADLQLKKPGIGIPPARLTELLQRTLRRDVVEGKFLEEDDFE